MAAECTTQKVEHFSVDWSRSDRNEANVAAKESANFVENQQVPKSVVIKDSVFILTQFRLESRFQ